MWDLPIQTHKYLIEPISNQPHMKFNIFKRHLNFKDQVFKSSKSVLKHLFLICMNNCNSPTGGNLRRLMLQCDLNFISEMNSSNISDLVYSEVPKTEKWRIGLVNELMNIRHGTIEVPGFSSDDISDILDYVCTS